MKYLFLILSMWSSSVLATWEFKQYENGNQTFSNTMIMPIIYAQSVCRFDFNYFDGNSYHSDVINVPGCSQSYIILDGFIYDLPNSYSFFMGESNWAIYDNLNMGFCSRINGGSIPSSYPSISLGPNEFKLNDEVANSIQNRNGSLYYFFTSYHGDIKCSNGIQYIPTGDVIFTNQFE